MKEQDTPKKRCTGPCGRTLDATSEHFYHNRSKCKECYKGHNKQKYADPDAKRRKKEYYKLNIEHKREYDKQRYIKEREDKIKKEHKKVMSHNKRAIKVKLEGTLTMEQWMANLDYFEWKCAYCQVEEYSLIEHFVPLVHGGGTTQHNCVPSCAKCNSIKQAWNPLSDWGPEFSTIKIGIERVKAYLETCKA